jgi:hypothetical protein
MTPPRKNGKGKTGDPAPSLSEQTHLEILDYFKVAAENSEHPAIRDAAIQLIKEKSKFQRKQEARLSPSLTLLIAVAILILAGVSSWFFFVHYPEHIAMILSRLAVGLAFVAACLVALFSGNLSQANFVHVLSMVWLKIVGMFSKSPAKADSHLGAGEDTGPSDSD